MELLISEANYEGIESLFQDEVFSKLVFSKLFDFATSQMASDICLGDQNLCQKYDFVKMPIITEMMAEKYQDIIGNESFPSTMIKTIHVENYEAFYLFGILHMRAEFNITEYNLLSQDISFDISEFINSYYNSNFWDKFRRVLIYIIILNS